MKKWRLILLVAGVLSVGKAGAQSHEIQQLLLDVEKLAQLKNILADLKKGYEIVLAGYGTIKDISQGTFNLHKSFLDRLLDVSPVVRNFRRVADIVATAGKMLGDYKKAYRQFTQSGRFTPAELAYISGVYSRLFDQSVNNLEALAKVVTAGRLRMSDDERLTAVDAVWKEVEDNYTFLTRFNNGTKVLALQRIKEEKEIRALKKLYNIH